MPAYRFQLEGAWNGSDVFMITPAYDVEPGITFLEVAAVLDEFFVHWEPMLTNLTGTQMVNWEWLRIILKRIDEITGSETELGQKEISIQGTETGQPLPAFVAAYVNLPVIGNPRSARLFLPGFGEDSSSGEFWSPGTQILLLNFITQWGIDFIGGVTGKLFKAGMWSFVQKVFFDRLPLGGCDVLASHMVTRKVGRGQ